MKKLHLVVWLIALGACHDEQVETPLVADTNYFPLNIGNHWRYEPAPGDNNNIFLEFEVVNKKVIAGNEYYQMIQTWISPGLTTEDTMYYRVDDFGNVFERRNSYEGVKFRLAALENESWDFAYYTSPPENGKMAVSKLTTQQLGQTSLDSCKVFFFDIKELIDEENWTTLAPGLGIVSLGSYWMRHNLKTATIDGRHFEF
jgi:hypothetical protein